MSDVSRSERSIRARQTFRILAWVLLAAGVIVFALLNTQQVDVDLLFDDVESALWIVIVGCAGIGFVVGYLAKARRG